ncbi:uncharacterized protein LOC143783127 isoform X2 [Ranitomeya variabilis]|uniref:uncharacterized protein LOC143783127 isoform X2 n=2 Tax=Ranitomeya variabilis TaxID=490064 RepID=UPI0040571255
MDKEQNEITKRLLNFTLEMIYLLTGEDYTIVKKTSDCVTPGSRLNESGGRSLITDPPPHAPIHERSNKKILELTNKIIELLTGEVPVRCQDVTVYFSMEEWEYLEGHKDLYEDVMMEDDQPRTSPDGSSRRNPPERCPRSLYSPDPPEENHTLPENRQDENLNDIKVVVIDDDDDDDDEEEEIEDERPCGFPAERCPRPLYSQDRPEENRHVPENRQGEDLTIIKVEVDTEDEWMRDEPPGHVEAIIIKNPSKKSYKYEDEAITQHSSGRYSYSQHGKLFPHKSTLGIRETRHTGEKPYPCLQCGKYFTTKSILVNHQKIHTGEKPYSCSDCGKSFRNKSHLVRHERIHTGERPYSCSVCGKCFTEKANLVTHERIHTGEKPFSCPECGKRFTDRSSLVTHQKIHKGVKPFPCTVCGKCFIYKSNLVRHERTHTGEKPYSCSLCGKCFTGKTNLVIHDRIHRGEKPYSCPVCGRCFTDKSSLFIHERIHTGEKPYSCSHCGKRFPKKSHLVKHQRIHTGEKPYSCSECGKCFTDKSSLVKHERSHTGEKQL